MRAVTVGNALVALGALGLTAALAVAGWHVLGVHRARSAELAARARAPEMVRVGELFIDRTEVTAESYRACAQAGACSTPSSGPHCTYGVVGKERHPVNCVDREQAAAYCRFTGRRLPTRDEWRAAARSADARRYPWGDADPSDQDCFGRHRIYSHQLRKIERPDLGTCAVDAHPGGATAKGVLGLGGNVAEWTSTRKSGLHFEVVGASWALRTHDGSSFRWDAELSQAEGMRDPLLGFRCVHQDRTLVAELLEGAEPVER